MFAFCSLFVWVSDLFGLAWKLSLVWMRDFRVETPSSRSAWDCKPYEDGCFFDNIGSETTFYGEGGDIYVRGKADL